MANPARLISVRLADTASVVTPRSRTAAQGTQEELAAKAGIGKNTVNRIERNLTEPRPSTLWKLAEALGVEPAELVEG